MPTRSDGSKSKALSASLIWRRTMQRGGGSNTFGNASPIELARAPTAGNVRRKMAKSKVCALKVKPSTILADIERLCDLAGMKQALNPSATTILKDNISWHF